MEPIHITITNETDLVLGDVVLGHVNNPGFIGDAYRVGDLNPGDSSSVLDVIDNQANYRMVAALVNDKRHHFVSFDFTERVGSKDLLPGDYTFRVVGAPTRRLELEIDQHQANSAG